MATVKPILETRVQKKDETYPIKIAIYHKGKTSFISLDISVLKDQFDGMSVINHPKAKILNQIIKTKLHQAESIILDLPAKASRYSISDIRMFIEANSTEAVKQEPVNKVNKYCLADHFLKYITQTVNARTKAIYQETLDKILKFDPKVNFDKANVSWLRLLDTELAKTCKTNTRAIHMRNIRAVFNDAIDEELISQNTYPFRKFKIKKDRTIKRTLTIAQIKQFRDYPVENHQERYRDLWMLIFYLIGINLVDLLKLRHSDYRNGRIEYIRAKTGRPYSIEVLPEAKAIIEKYKGKGYLLDVLDTYANYKDFGARMNENIKEIGMQTRTGRGGKITRVPLFPDLIIYTARRSWATIASGLDIQKDTIAAALGHGGNTVTDLYVRFDLKKVDVANKQIINSIQQPV
jgi:integrase